MQPEKVHFTEEKETMLITLYARAMQSRSSNPVLRDPWAEAAIERIDYDFAHLKQTELEELSIAIRAKNFDRLTKQYLTKHPNAVIVQLGCGMDSRVFRVDPPAGALWFDVDYPDVIDLRRRLYPERSGYTLIGTSLADLDWIDQLPTDRPAMIVAEGVTMYLTASIVEPLFKALTEHFPSGEMTFDAFNHLGLRTAQSQPSIKGTGAAFVWGFDSAEEIKRFAPKLNLVAEMRTPELDGFDRLPATMRAVVRGMDMIPVLRRMNRVVLFQF